MRISKDIARLGISTPSETHRPELFEGTVRVVEAFVGNNPVAQSELPSLIESVHRALGGFGVKTGAGADKPARTEPAVPVERSVFKSHIVCLECGGSFKSLRRHLAARHDTYPEAYRETWGLPSNYPMVAPAYSAVRSKLAKSLVGTGRGE